MELINNQYTLQGISLLKLAEKYGTPLYVYDAAKMLAKIQQLKSAFTGINMKVKFAIKSLSNINVLRFFRQQNIGVDVVSIQELYLAQRAGFAAKDIMFTPNCVGFDEIEKAIELGIPVNIDNIAQLEIFGHKYGNKVPICIRINPHLIGGGNHKIQTGHIDSKFGISILQMRHLHRVVSANNIHVHGLHVHTGSDILDANVFLNGANIILDAAREFDNLEFIDFGSGFKVAYQQGDNITDIAHLGKKMTETVQQFCKDYGKELEIWFEPGKFLVSEAGHFLVKTNVVKQTPATTFAGVDAGLNHLIRPMMYNAYHNIKNISNPKGQQRVYDVVGYICETDTLGNDRKLNEVRVGDILSIQNAGAYCFSMSSNYNSRYRPAEILIHNGEAHLIRQRENFEDLLRNQIELDLFEPEKQQLNK